MIQVKIVNKSKNELPAYATELSAGMDLRADLSNIKHDKLFFSHIVKDDPEGPITGILINPKGRALIGTGLYIQLPKGYEAQVRSRSGLAINYGLHVLNSPGTIDADYRGEICIILQNSSEKPYIVKDGERIAQLVISSYDQAELELVDSLEETERGEGGFGSTGTK